MVLVIYDQRRFPLLKN